MCCWHAASSPAAPDITPRLTTTLRVVKPDRRLDSGASTLAQFCGGRRPRRAPERPERAWPVSRPETPCHYAAQGRAAVWLSFDMAAPEHVPNTATKNKALLANASDAPLTVATPHSMTRLRLPRRRPCKDDALEFAPADAPPAPATGKFTCGAARSQSNHRRCRSTWQRPPNLSALLQPGLVKNGSANGLQRFAPPVAHLQRLTGTPLARLHLRDFGWARRRSWAKGLSAQRWPAFDVWRKAPPFAGATALACPKKQQARQRHRRGR